MYSTHSEKRSSKILYTVAEDPDLDLEPNITQRNDIEKCNLYYRLCAKVPARLVLYLLSWSGFLVSFMMRNDMNFALTAMNSTSNAQNNTNSTNNDSSVASLSQDEEVWSSTVQSVIVSSFYWSYVLSQVVGGIATQYYGTKRVFGWSQFATAFCSLTIPFAAGLHYKVVILLRSIQGFASGLTWPAMYAVVGFWIPLTERSRFMSSFQGFSIGIGLTYAISGFITSNFGWRYIFYTTGTLGMVWCAAWYFLAYDTPRGHPRISREELEYIEVNISASAKETLEKKVPWMRIFLSLPAWAIAITTFGRIWIHYIFIVNGPKFMKNILKFDYEANGFLSGMPFICSYLSSLLFCYIADEIVLHNWLSLKNVRKLFTALSQIVPGLLIYWIGYMDDSITWLLVLWFTAVIFITASYAGAMATIVDIAPNFAGQVLAFCQTIHMSASFLSPLVSGIIVTDETSITQWRTVFAVSSVITVATYLVYQIYGTSDIQKWNNSQPSNERSSENSEILKKQDDETLPKDA